MTILFFFALSLKIALAQPNCAYNAETLQAAYSRWVTEKSFMSDRSAKMILSEITACEKLIAETKTQGCFQRMTGFIRSVKMQPDSTHSLGFLQSNEDYYKSRPAGSLDLPEELRNGLPKDWEALAKKKGWLTLTYKSRSVPNPPNKSYRRLLMVIQDEKYDRFVQFTLPEVEGDTERLIDYISVEKASAKTNFTQYWLTQGKYQFKARTNDCFTCHSSGLREIVPLPGSHEKSDNTTVEKINEVMRKYQKVDWDGAIVPENHGPAWGTASCTRCHDSQGRAGFLDRKSKRGTLNYSTRPEQIELKVLHDMTMPEWYNQDLDLANAMAKVEQLPKAVRDRMRGTITNEEILKLLLDHKLIKDSEFQELSVNLKEYRDFWAKNIAEDNLQYREKMKNWASGEDQCPWSKSLGLAKEKSFWWQQTK